MRSARYLFAPLLTLAAATFAGCSTTQQTASRLRLNDARIRASELVVQVRGRDPRVEVTAVSVVADPSGSAIVVKLRNLSATPVSDLPVSVGVIYDHRNSYLNSRPGSNYFQTHIPAISGRGTLTWVFTTPHRLSTRTRPSVVIGPPTAPPPSVPRALPDLAVRLTPGSGVLRGGALHITVQNRSAVPQYQLPVYATATRGGLYVAAGEGSIAELDGGSAARLELRLTGNASGASISIETPPTIFN